jgi:hypothetical protein
MNFFQNVLPHFYSQRPSKVYYDKNKSQKGLTKVCFTHICYKVIGGHNHWKEKWNVPRGCISLPT